MDAGLQSFAKTWEGLARRASQGLKRGRIIRMDQFYLRDHGLLGMVSTSERGLG